MWNHQCIATQSPCYCRLFIKSHKKITWIWMMEMPVKTTLRLYCDDSHLVSSVWNHQCTARQFWSIVYRTATVKTKWIWRENGLPQQRLFFFVFFSMCKLHVRRGSLEANPGLSTSNLLLSLSYLYLIFILSLSYLYLIFILSLSVTTRQLLGDWCRAR